MFGTVRKHQTWLWIIIIAATIISFVFTFNPASRNSGQRGQGSYDLGSIDGQSITSDEYSDARAEVAITYFLSNHEWPERKSGFDLETQTYYRIFLNRKLKQYDIHVDDATVARLALIRVEQFAQNFLQGQPLSFDGFITNFLASGRVTADDFERCLRHEIGMQQLFSVVGLSGDLITPQEAQTLYEHQYQPIVTEAVFFSGSNYLARVPAPTEQLVVQFYTNEMAAYRLPERVQVKYAAFSITNHLAEAQAKLTNITEIVDANMEKLGTNYVRFGKTPDAARNEIRERVIHEAALGDADEEARRFISELFTNDPVRIENMEALAREKGLTFGTTKPFDQMNGPVELTGETNYAQTAFNFAKAAFVLTPDEPFSLRPVIGDNAVYVIALDRKLPSEIPPLGQIRDRVAEDYRYSKAVKLAQDEGERFEQSVTNGLAHGKSFAEVCSESKMTPVHLPPFSLSTRDLPNLDDRDFSELRQIAFTTEPGKASNFAATAEGGLIVYVDRRMPIDDSKMKQELPVFLANLRQRRQQEAAYHWIDEEAGKSLRGTPLNKPKNPDALTSENP